MSQRDVQQIQIQIDTARELLKDSEALDRLYKNKDFIRLIEKKYLQAEPVRITHLMADPAFNSDAKREDLTRQLSAVAHFLGFLREINRVGEHLRDEVKNFEDEQEAARLED